MTFDLNEYVDVAERIKQFYEKYPEGRLRRSEVEIKEVGGKAYVMYTALAYRSPDDPYPGHGTAWEPVPGPTQFTLNSEVMNAETAAWGRAIVSLGFTTKKIASKQEVEARQGEAASLTDQARSPSSPQGGPDPSAGPPNGEPLATEKQAKMLWSVAEGNRGRKLKREEAQEILLKAVGVTEYDKVPKARVDEAKAALQGAPIPTGQSDVPAPKVEVTLEDAETGEEIPF